MDDRLILPTTRAVFFDAVDTLIEPYPSAAEAYHMAGKRHGIRLKPEDVRQRFAEAFRREEEQDAANDFIVNDNRERQRWRNIVSNVFRGAPIVDVLFEELWRYFAQPNAWRLMPGAAETLQELARRHLTLGLSSNFDSRLHGLADSFPDLAMLNHRVISSEVGWRKPSPRFFNAVARIARCEARNIVFVGDRLDVDYAGAEAAGMHAVLLEDAPGHAPDIRQARTLTDLLG